MNSTTGGNFTFLCPPEKYGKRISAVISMFFGSCFQEFLHSGNMTEAGPLDLIDDDDEQDDYLSLPGVLKGQD